MDIITPTAAIFAIILCLLIAASYNVSGLYYVAFIIHFGELTRLLIAYPFDPEPVIWFFRFVFLFITLIILPTVLRQYLAPNSW